MARNSGSVDAIVVGGGIVGSAVTIALAGAGLKVACVDSRGPDPSSATLASGAMLGAVAEASYSKRTVADEKETAFRVRSADRYATWLEALNELAGTNTEIGRGTFVIANSSGDDDLRNIDWIKETADRHAVASTWIDASAKIPGFHPHLSKRPQKILFLPTEGYVDAGRLLEAAQTAIDRADNAEIIQGEVVAVTVAAGRVTGVRLHNGDCLWAPHVVLCPGAAFNSVIMNSGLADLNLPRVVGGKGSSFVVNERHQVSHVIRTPNRDFACGTHVVPRRPDALYVGATNRLADTPGSANGVSAGELHTLLHNLLHEVNVGLRASEIGHFKSGVRPMCVDGFPLIGKTDLVGLTVATGTYRNGVLMAPLIGDIVADLIVGHGRIENPFAPENRAILLPRHDLDRLIETGVSDLMLMVQGPHGVLPYDRSREIADILSVLLRNAMTSAGEFEELLAEAKRDFLTNPMTELVPTLMYRIQSLKHNNGSAREPDDA